MSVIYKIIILQFLILPFYSSAQENKAKTINYEINFIPFQTAIVGNNKFTPNLNEEYTSFDINLSKSQFRFLASKSFKTKWIGGLGIGFVQTKANWVVGFNKDNSSFFNSIHTYSNQLTLNLDIQLGYQLFKNTTANLLISPHFEIYSKSNHTELANSGSFVSSDGFRADYTEYKGRYYSFLTYELQLKTYISKSFFINYGINITRYGNPKINKLLYYYEMKGRPPFFEKGETIMLIKVGGYIPFGYIGFGYKFNSK